MRVISGTLKGRRFQPPAKIPARPTTDFAKEGLFNILTNQRDIPGENFLDLFGGTGSISYEMGSRGCEQIVLVEKMRRALPSSNSKVPLSTSRLMYFKWMFLNSFAQQATNTPSFLQVRHMRCRN